MKFEPACKWWKLLNARHIVFLCLKKFRASAKTNFLDYWIGGVHMSIKRRCHYLLLYVYYSRVWIELLMWNLRTQREKNIIIKKQHRSRINPTLSKLISFVSRLIHFNFIAGGKIIHFVCLLPTIHDSSDQAYIWALIFFLSLSKMLVNVRDNSTNDCTISFGGTEGDNPSSSSFNPSSVSLWMKD